MQYELLLKLMAAHFLSDFLLQPAGWVNLRNQKHFKAWSLYLHALVTALMIVLLCGIQLWWIALLIGFSHIVLDGLKSHTRNGTSFFLADQFIHLSILVVTWILIAKPPFSWEMFTEFYNRPTLWLYISAILFLTTPTGFLIGLLTTRWRIQLSDLKADTPSLEKAGMMIGIIERLLIFFLVIIGKFEAIGLLIAAKSLLRFNEKERPEVKTEYLLVGTLLSVAIATATGFLVTSIQF